MSLFLGFYLVIYPLEAYVLLEIATTLAIPTRRATRTIIEPIVVPAEIKDAETVAMKDNPAIISNTAMARQ